MNVVTVYEVRQHVDTGATLSRLYAIRESIAAAMLDVESGFSDSLLASYVFVIEDLTERQVLDRLKNVSVRHQKLPKEEFLRVFGV